ncbi:hypothetical protein GGR03_000047 [Aurantimonas endophytica]|uniref:Uncharacterized protein n=1 Tax=Aurantimonas endophytica TaxID=1522175 RepID=A0A7W6H9A7_9HYPH|nr:hypothetical protein [Aurantimonas endophytica]
MKPTHQSFTISTLGDLVDNGMGIAWACDDCHRDLDLTLSRAIEMWGHDQTYVRWKAPVRCVRCGSRNVSMRIRANTTIKQATGRPFEPS